MVAILSACRARGYLPPGLWTVVTAYSGLETCMKAIRLMRPPQPAVLLAASEWNPVCRSFYPGAVPYPSSFSGRCTICSCYYWRPRLSPSVLGLPLCHLVLRQSLPHSCGSGGRPQRPPTVSSVFSPRYVYSFDPALREQLSHPYA
eukprot:3003682-Prymnesium_polylepis.1